MINIKSLLGKMLNLAFPPVCLQCLHRIDRQDMWLCGECRDKLSYLPELQCPVCGFPEVAEECEACLKGGYTFTKAKSVFMYDGVVKTLVHSLKYKGYTGLAEWFANQMYILIDKEKRFAEVDVITSIPLHKVKKRERGFNQSELIARALAKKLNLPYNNDLLKRKINTRSQTQLDGLARRRNLAYAFSAGKIDLKKKKILVIDDVFTTGTTVNEAAKVLKASGAEVIYVMTACHG